MYRYEVLITIKKKHLLWGVSLLTEKKAPTTSTGWDKGVVWW
jgi:hypothetical protein